MLHFTKLQTKAVKCQIGFLFSMKNVHPPDGLSVADLSQIDLGGLQVLMSQKDFGDDLQWNTISASICS